MRRLALAALLAAAPASAGVRPAHGGAVRLALPALPTTFDPALAVEPQDLLAARATSGALLELDAAGRLVPGLLEEVPAAEAGGRAYRLRLRADLRTFDDRPVGAAELAAALTRLASPATASPHAWAVLPILGAEAVLAGRATTLAGVQVLSEQEILVTLSLPLPNFPRALAALPFALPGLGPFQPPRAAPSGGALALAPNPRCPRGRPFAASLVLVAVRDPRTSARLLERGEVDLVIRPEAVGGRPGVAIPALGTVVAALSKPKLSTALESVQQALLSLDRDDLARRARGPAEPMDTLAPRRILAGGPSPGSAPKPAAGTLPPQLVLLIPDGSPDARAAAERIQVKLFDLGSRVGVESLPRARFEARLATGAYDIALVPVTVLTVDPVFAAAQIAYAARGIDGAHRAFSAVSATDSGAASAGAEGVARTLALVPLFAVAPRASLGPAAQGLAPRADGGFDPGELWRLGGGAR